MDPMFEKTMTPYQYAYQNPVKFIDPTGMAAEDGGGDGGFWRSLGNLFKSNARLHAETKARSLQNDPGVRQGSISTFNSSKAFKSWSVSYTDLDADSETHILTYSNDGYISGLSIGKPMRDMEGTAIGRSYMASMSSGTISSPISTNTISYQMGSASGQLGVAGFHGIGTFGSIVAGEAVLGAVGLGSGISLSGSAAAGDALGGLGVQTSLKVAGNSGTVYNISVEAMKKHVIGGVQGRSIFYPDIDANSAVLEAANYADNAGLWIGNKAKVPVLNTNVGTLGNGRPTNIINVYRNSKGTVHGSPGS